MSSSQLSFLDTRQAILLFVDDDPNVLKALERLFHNENYQIHTASGGAAGLAILKEHAVDLIISDMRMPDMDGSEFFANVFHSWPETVRILLTGFADLQSTIDAINSGRVYRYCSKPWNDVELKQLVAGGLEQKWLREERDHLSSVISRQNEELKRLNVHLEDRVEQRTAELKRSLYQIDQAHKSLLLRNQAIEAAQNGIVISDAGQPDHPIVYVNKAFTLITGYEFAEAQGQNLSFLLQGESRPCSESDSIDLDVYQHQAGHAILRNVHKEGRPFWNQLNIAPVKNSIGEVTHLVTIIDDITEVKAYQEKLEYLANYDELTGLINRNLFNDRLEQAIRSAQRHNNEVYVFFLDLDNFKVINDSLGHSSGDELLKVVAKRMLKRARAEDSIARYGGDKFMLLFSKITIMEDAELIAERLLADIARPLKIKNHKLQGTVSIGISCYPRDGQDRETLLKHADAAMYHAKDKGRNTFCFYTEELNLRLMQRLTMEFDLRQALKLGQLMVYYQPKYELRTGKIKGLEALLRWRHPEKGMISPDQFISLAEDTGLILPIGEWVLRTACHQAKAWQQAGLTGVSMAVNVSPKQLHLSNFEQTIVEVLQDTGLEPGYLDLELTEGAVMKDPEHMVVKLQGLKEIGVQISMDDFGTGYSSLSYLKRFPFDNLKIDKAFIDDICAGGNVTLVLTIIAMAHSFNLKVVAEGVETKQQMDFLKQHHCDEIQGFYFSKPLPAKETEQLLTTMNANAAIPAC